MPLVNLKIGIYEYKMACEEGQEEQLLSMAEKVNKRLQENAAMLGRGMDNKTLVLTCLMMENEIEDYKASTSSSPSNTIVDTQTPSAPSQEVINSVATAIENLAFELENS